MNTKRKKGKFKIVLVVLAIIVIFMVIGSSGSDTGTNTPSNTSDSNGQNDAARKDDAQPDESGTGQNQNEDALPESDDNTPSEYKSALNKAKLYSDTMYMSKQGIYEQLTSEYGEKFSTEAGQYAIDNLNAD